MFYLKLFYKQIISTPIKGATLILLFFLLLLSISLSTKISEQVAQIVPQENESSFFTALISNKDNYSWISRKIKKLPGVKRISVVSTLEIKEHVNKLINSLNIEMNDIGVDTSYIGLKIFFKEAISHRSKVLVRDYLSRLTGNNDITIGEIQTSSFSKYNFTKIDQKVNRWVPIISVAIIGIIWLLAWGVFVKDLKNLAYLTEKYQRKQNIFFKTSVIIIALSVIVECLFVYLFKVSVEFYLLIAIVNMTALIISNKRIIWEN